MAEANRRGRRFDYQREADGSMPALFEKKRERLCNSSEAQSNPSLATNKNGRFEMGVHFFVVLDNALGSYFDVEPIIIVVRLAKI